MPSKGPYVPAGYAANHSRLSRQRGRAAEKRCAEGCGRQASQWAQIHGTDGTDPFEHYKPLCRPCHANYDKAERCPHGHLITPENRIKNGFKDGVQMYRCRPCNDVKNVSGARASVQQYLLDGARGVETAKRLFYNQKERNEHG